MLIQYIVGVSLCYGFLGRLKYFTEEDAVVNIVWLLLHRRNKTNELLTLVQHELLSSPASSSRVQHSPSRHSALGFMQC